MGQGLGRRRIDWLLVQMRMRMRTLLVGRMRMKMPRLIPRRW